MLPIALLFLKGDFLKNLVILPKTHVVHNSLPGPGRKICCSHSTQKRERGRPQEAISI
jgi:hypothetical protein